MCSTLTMDGPRYIHSAFYVFDTETDSVRCQIMPFYNVFKNRVNPPRQKQQQTPQIPETQSTSFATPATPIIVSIPLEILPVTVSNNHDTSPP